MCLLLFPKNESEAEMFICKARDIDLMTIVNYKDIWFIVDYSRFNQLVQ